MKQLVLLLCLICSFNLFSQTGTIFPNHYGIWDVRAWTFDETAPGTPAVEYYAQSYTLQMVADSIFEEDMIWFPIKHFGLGENIGQVTFDAGIVYFKSYDENYPETGTGTETVILYNFNLEVGDTAYMHGFEYITITNIGTTTALGDERTFFDLSNGDMWIYGMGSIEGLFRPLINPFEYKQDLCFFEGFDLYEDDSVSYYSYYGDGLACTLGLEDNNVETVVSVYPNPATQSFSIMYEGKTAPYFIRDLSGKIQLQGVLNHGINTIDSNELTPGVYFIHLEDNFIKLVID